MKMRGPRGPFPSLDSPPIFFRRPIFFSIFSVAAIFSGLPKPVEALLYFFIYLQHRFSPVASGCFIPFPPPKEGAPHLP